jgi:hypothetical protein
MPSRWCHVITLQEHLAVQLIKLFDGTFRDAMLPLWLYPYEVCAGAGVCVVM